MVKVHNLILPLLGFAALFYSCTKNLEDKKERTDFTVPDGILRFADEEEFFSAVDIYSDPDADISGLEAKYNFKSLRTETARIWEYLDNIDDPDIFKTEAYKYSDYFTLDRHGMLHPKFVALGYMSFANTDGLFYVGNDLYKVLPDKIELYPGSETTRSAEPLRVEYCFDVDGWTETRADRKDYMFRRYMVQNDRWLWIEGKTIAYFTKKSNNTFDVKYTFQISSYQYFYNWLGVYKKNKTIFYFDNLIWSFAIPSKTGSYSTSDYSGYITSNNFANGHNHSYSSKETKDYSITYNSSRIFNLNQPYIPEVKIMRFRARSRGVGNCGLVENFNVPAGYPQLSRCK